MGINDFRCFQSAAAMCWADPKYWYADKDEVPWEVFMPCINEFNSKRRSLLKAVLLMLDESMSGWRPKTSKLGGLPNYTYEPRKPIPLGMMFRNGVECITGIFLFNDPVQGPEKQQMKKYHGDPSNLPGNESIGAHTAKTVGLEAMPGLDL